MTKPLKVLLRIVLALVVLAGIAVLAASMIDANRYRPQIAARVKQATGRDLNMTSIHLSLFPVIGISLKDARLSNAAGFGDQPQLVVGDADVGVRLLPLLFQHRIEVGRIRLDDASIDLQVAADGHNNWSDLQQSRTPQAQAGPSPAPAPQQKAVQSAILIGGIDIRNATIHYSDHRSGRSYTAANLDLKTGSINPGKSFDISLDFQAQLSQPAIAATVKAAAQLKLDPQPLHYAASGLSLHIDGNGADLPGGKLLLDLKADVDGNADSVALANLHLKLDDSNLGGRFALTSLQQMTASFALQVDQFDLDRYQPAARKAPDGGEPPASEQLSKSSDDTRIPLDALDSFGLDGTIDLGHLIVKGMSASNVHLAVQAPRGVQKHFQLTANLYGGTLGSDTLISPGAEPRYGQNLQLKAIDVGALLRDYLHKDKVAGKGDIDLKFTSAGETVGAVKRALNGELSFALQNAAIKGFNLAQIIRQGQALMGGQNLQQNANSSAAEQTDFSAITGGGPIVNGVLHGDRLDGRSPLLRLAGSGTIDFVHETIDYLAQPTLVNTTSGQGGRDLADLNGITVPVQVTGTFDNPQYRIDVRSALEQKAVQRLSDRLGQKNSGISNFLQGLGGLFGGRSQNQQAPQQNNGNPSH